MCQVTMNQQLKESVLQASAGCVSQAVATPERWRKEGADAGPQPVSGQQGQLIEFDEAANEWSIALFSADIVAAEESCIRPLSAADLQDYDIALGPASDTGVMGAELTERLSDQGYAVCRLFVAPDDLEEMARTADRCAREGAFTRLAAEIESGYLGQARPGVTTLTLTPKAITDQAPVMPQLSILPGMLCVFCMDRFKFAHQSEGEKSLSLSAFFLDAPREYVIDNITGDLTFLTGTISGPAQPKTDSVPAELSRE
eukprot:Skav234013  [mRNA]  locus=scaffold3484:107977:115205:- [translate_table: standard]